MTEQVKKRGRPAKPQKAPADPEVVRQVIERKNAGETFAAIGRSLGMSRQGASYLYERWRDVR